MISPYPGTLLLSRMLKSAGIAAPQSNDGGSSAPISASIVVAITLGVVAVLIAGALLLRSALKKHRQNRRGYTHERLLPSDMFKMKEPDTGEGFFMGGTTQNYLHIIVCTTRAVPASEYYHTFRDCCVQARVKVKL